MIEFQLKLTFFILLLFESLAETCSLFLVHSALAALLGLSLMSVLVDSHLAGLLNGMLHHLLLFEPLSDVVSIEAEVALLAETEQDLRTKAAAYD